MKFFTIYEIINSIFFSVISGIIFGGIYCASESILVFLKEMLLIFPVALKILPDISIKRILTSTQNRAKISFGNIERNVFEAILFFFFGISVILICYVALDGYIRLYMFIVTALFFVLSRKYIGKIFSSVFKRLFGAVYFIIVLFVSILLWPLYKVLNKVAPLFKKLLSPLIYSVRKNRSARILHAKLREIRKVMKLNA